MRLVKVSAECVFAQSYYRTEPRTMQERGLGYQQQQRVCERGENTSVKIAKGAQRSDFAIFTTSLNCCLKGY